MEKPIQTQKNNLAEVALFFLRLGFTAFGGPAAYIAMMRREVVERRHWISDERFLDLLILVPSSTLIVAVFHARLLSSGVRFHPCVLIGAEPLHRGVNSLL